MSLSPLIDQLIAALRCLPGVGPKSAQRMALHLLERNRPGGLQLAQSLSAAMQEVGQCSACRTFCETELCNICANNARDPMQLCVVESPADILAFEATGSYRGYYFVLHGHLSPIDGIGPEQIGLDLLLERVKSQQIAEVILATNPTVEGEATAHYISSMLESLTHLSRLAHGVPIGGELEYVDGGTLAHALAGRTKVS